MPKPTLLNFENFANKYTFRLESFVDQKCTLKMIFLPIFKVFFRKFSWQARIYVSTLQEEPQIMIRIIRLRKTKRVSLLFHRVDWSNDTFAIQPPSRLIIRYFETDKELQTQQNELTMSFKTLKANQIYQIYGENCIHDHLFIQFVQEKRLKCHINRKLSYEFYLKEGVEIRFLSEFLMLAQTLALLLL